LSETRVASRDLVGAVIDRLVADARLPTRAAEDDLRRELWSHFDEAGTTPEAWQDALTRFGAPSDVAAALRVAHQPDSGPGRFTRRVMTAVLASAVALGRGAGHLGHDLRFGVRMLRRSPGVSIIAVLCLTAGIGANTAVFGWVEGILFRPFPGVVAQDRMVAMIGRASGETGSTDLSWPDVQDLGRTLTSAEAVIADKIMGATLSLGDGAQKITGSIVSANYFDALGVHPVLGRGFEPGEDVGNNAHPVAVISYQLWQDLFAGDPAIVGRPQRLNGLEHTIVGVAPEGFHGTFVGYAMQVWVPASMEPTFETGGYKLDDRGARWIEGFVRLKRGVSLGAAEGEVAALSARLDATYPPTNRGRSIGLLPLWQTPFNKAGELRPTLGILLGVAAFVLLIVCANVGNLLLVRALARRREMTIRLSIGASRGRLVRQLLTEGLLLTTLAAMGAMLVAYWCQHALVWFFPYRVSLPGALDWRVLAVSAAVTLTSTLALGLVPALQTRRLDLVEALRSESAAVVGGHGGSWVRSGLVLVQVSLSFALLTGAGLLLESLRAIQTANPGFATEGVLATTVDLFGAGYDAGRAKVFLDTLTDRVGAVPGVEGVALARTLPLGLLPFSSAPIAVDGYVPRPDEQPTVDYNQVGPGYFSTVGVPLVSGRPFTTADDEGAQPVAIVNERMAAEYWGGRNPVGSRLRVRNRSLEVVGVARGSKYASLTEPARPFFYVPLRQDFSGRVALEIKTRRQAADLAPAISRQIRSLDPSLIAYDVVTVHDRIDRATSSQRIAVTVLVGFGALALVLAAVGLYGVMSYVVSQQTREMGLRLSLGATTSDLVTTVLSRGALLTATGLVLGGLATLALARFGAGLLYQTSPSDPRAFGTAAAALALASLSACGLPAWRAARIDPIQALRD
jgi:macrolide transport system ATP-binding/permease protein